MGEKNSILLEEWKMWSAFIQNRARTSAMWESIMISGSFIAITVILPNLDKISIIIADIIFFMSIVLLLSGIFYFDYRRKVDSLIWDRINQLEKELKIEAHSVLFSRVKKLSFFRNKISLRRLRTKYEYFLFIGLILVDIAILLSLNWDWLSIVINLAK